MTRLNDCEQGAMLIRDPSLIVAYFFSGAEKHATMVKERLNSLFDTLAHNLEIEEQFSMRVHSNDLRYIRFERYRWNPASLAILLQFHVQPSQVWCVQFGMPLHEGNVSLREALDNWRETECQLRAWEDGLTLHNQTALFGESEQVYWGSSRLYWALSDEVSEDSVCFLDLAQEVQSIAIDQDSTVPSYSVHPQAYEPQSQTGEEYGMLWRLDEPAVRDGHYQAAWLLLSPPDKDDLVSGEYIFNGRFAIGEAYLCKAHYQAAQYPHIASELREKLVTVQSEISTLLELEGPTGFEPDQMDQAQDNLRNREARLYLVSKAYSRLLFILSIIDRLHLTVKTNLENYEQMKSEFTLWKHPATRTETERLRGVLRQIEHDQRSRRASLEASRVALDTVRTSLDLTNNQIAATRLDIEQEESRRALVWDIIIAILGVVLGVSQVIILTKRQFWFMILYSVPLVIILLIVVLWWRCAGKHQR